MNARFNSNVHTFLEAIVLTALAKSLYACGNIQIKYLG